MTEIIDLDIINEEAAPGIIVFTLKGNLDGGTFTQVERVFNTFLTEDTCKFIVDLTELEYVSSAGAGVLLGWCGVLEEKQGRMVIINPQPKVQMVFDMLGLPNFITIVNNRAAALKLLS
jgi:anti-anti-sigma factor